MNAPRSLALLAFAIALTACQRDHAAARVPVLDWRTGPLDLNLRGMNGKSYLFRCPAGKPVPGSVTGSGVYTDASSICAAAAHAGAIDAQRGGLVMIQILPGRNGYRGSMQNFIRSATYPRAWGGSFAVLSVADSSGGGEAMMHSAEPPGSWAKIVLQPKSRQIGAAHEANHLQV